MAPTREQAPDQTAAAGARLPAPQRGSGSGPAGNRAVSRVVKRHADTETGLRRADAIERFVQKAVAFLRRNPDGRMIEYALYLGADVNTELERIGVPAVGVHVGKQGNGAAGEFFADSWQMVLQPGAFSHREGVETMGDLTPDEAALVAHTIFHEARHAEQHFRIARLQAAEGEEVGPELEESVAKAAAANPLTAGTGSARELKEAKDWQTNEYGADATYREAVTTWMFELHETLLLVRGVDAGNAADVRDRLARRVAGWVGSGAGEYIRSHLADAKGRKAAQVVADITTIDKALTHVQTAQGALPEGATPDSFKPLFDALIVLYKAVYATYTRQPVEHDAFAAGNAVFDAFSKAEAPARAPHH